MSILSDVVSYIPTTTEDVITNDAFKQNLVLNIETALSTLLQNGVGNPVSIVADDSVEWDQFFGDKFVDRMGQSQAKLYVYLKTQLLFDTPQPSVVTIMEKAAEEALWRARLEFDIESNREERIR